MSARLNARLAERLGAARAAGTYKEIRVLSGPVGARVQLEERGEVVSFCSNDYLGLSNHPEILAAAKAGVDRFGASAASVRFICGTLTVHRELERALANLLGTGSALTFSSCWAANTGLLPAITSPGDVILSDELNHASIIDGCRAARGVTTKVYRHADVGHLEKLLTEHRDAPSVLIVTDGVFSMEGDLAPLPAIASLARRFGATIVLDDSHGMGVLGATGRGTAEHFQVLDQIDIFTGTLGKALGAGTGGFVAASLPVIDILSQASRPHLFSNALPASIASAAVASIDLLRSSPDLATGLRRKASRFRAVLQAEGIRPLPGDSAIVPVIVGDTAAALALADRLLSHRVLVTGLGYPVVPEGQARLRFQVNLTHSEADFAEAVAALQIAQRKCG